MRSLLAIFLISTYWHQTLLSQVHPPTTSTTLSTQAKETLLQEARTANLIPPADPRGEIELTVCSQNLKNYGEFPISRSRTPELTRSSYEDKGTALVARFLKAECDLIAVQEALGSSQEEANKALTRLAQTLKLKTNREFKVISGDSNEQLVRNGFIYATDRVELLASTSYLKAELPKLQKKEKTRFFLRGPLELQMRILGREQSPSRLLTIVTFHFKSRAGASLDPAELEWETYRMQMAEALRRIIEARFESSFEDNDRLLIVLGDRNSHFDTASARILEGILTLQQFRKNGVCRLSRRGVPLCRAGVMQPQKLFSVLTTDPETKLQAGTHIYRGEASWLDDILVSQGTLPFLQEQLGIGNNYNSGLINLPAEASDHALIYVKLNW